MCIFSTRNEWLQQNDVIQCSKIYLMKQFISSCMFWIEENKISFGIKHRILVGDISIWVYQTRHTFYRQPLTPGSCSTNRRCTERCHMVETQLETFISISTGYLSAWLIFKVDIWWCCWHICSSIAEAWTLSVPCYYRDVVGNSIMWPVIP